MDRLKALLSRGYFPIQLPPPFISDSFAIKKKAIDKAWSGQQLGSYRAERFSVARSSYRRRVTSIVNPVPFFFLAKELATNWAEVQRHFQKSKISLSRPTFKVGIRAIEISKFSDLYEQKVSRSKGYRFVLVTDISRYFPTIYTHTLPWALHGKSVAKRKRRDKTLLGNRLDDRSMDVQDRQTIGLPIGPDTSHILSEIIGTAIDCDLKRTTKVWPAGFRYVDDFYFFFSKRDEAEAALRELIRSMSAFELQFNPDKTKIMEVRDLLEESWKYRIRALRISNSIRIQRDDIHHFFEALFSLTSHFNDESVVKYGLRILSGKIIKKPNWGVFEAYLLKCGYSFPNSIQTVVSLLLTYRSFDFPLDRKAISRFCNSLIAMHATSDGHSEIAWALWLAKNMNIRLTKETGRMLETSSSSVCLLLALDLQRARLIPYKFSKQFLSGFAKLEALSGDNWLLAYEAGRRLWLGNSDASVIQSDPFFKHLLGNDVSFYFDKAEAKPVFVLKGAIDLRLVFESDANVDSQFDFLDVDEEYFDPKHRNDEEEFEGPYEGDEEGFAF